MLITTTDINLTNKCISLFAKKEGMTIPLNSKEFTKGVYPDFTVSAWDSRSFNSIDPGIMQVEGNCPEIFFIVKKDSITRSNGVFPIGKEFADNQDNKYQFVFCPVSSSPAFLEVKNDLETRVIFIHENGSITEAPDYSSSKEHVLYTKGMPIEGNEKGIVIPDFLKNKK